MYQARILIILALLLSACSGNESTAEPTTEASAQAKPTATITRQISPTGEPSEEVLQRLEFQRYAELEKAGGIPVTISATGQQTILRPKLYSVRKDECTPTPQAPVGWYECSLTISLSLAEDGSNPSEQGEGFSVKWDSESGTWVPQ